MADGRTLQTITVLLGGGDGECFARSIILTATAAMAGGTQMSEGAHLTSGNTRFCRKDDSFTEGGPANNNGLP